ncbi:MAG: zinc ribbon domain-containing protein, partial [Deltaproteobacteria bacterium]|nr:zinc ribbon domain-containing protein [Deltaproteobacteria bacterium]
MPIYEYKCQQCGRVSEVFQKFSDEPLSECLCGGEMKKLISLNSFHLKGSGWY